MESVLNEVLKTTEGDTETEEELQRQLVKRRSAEKVPPLFIKNFLVFHGFVSIQVTRFVKTTPL